MSTEFWKIEKDLCRCCHSEGSHKNLAEPCLEGGDEIYSEMLHDTLDINISPVSGDLGTVTYTICEVCIMRLQDAWSFKQQVLQCENRFNDLYTKNVIKLEPDCVVVSIKEEADSDNEGFKEEKLDDSDGDFEMSFGDGNNSDSDMDTKPKSKAKPKAKSKTTPKAPPKRKPATKTASKTSTTSEAAEGQAEPKEKKDTTSPSKELADFTVIKGKKKNTYSCNKCGKVSTTPWRIKSHIKYAHTEAAQACVCEVCHRKFMNLPKLNDHVRNVHLLVECPECHLKFTRGRLISHRAKIHGTVPTRDCGVCGYKTTSNRHLIDHQRRVHMQEKNVSCPRCDMKFFDERQLKLHMVRHNPVKKFECKFCDKMFSRPLDRERHERIHTGDKRKVCNICGERFVQKASLTHHMLKRHPDAV